MSKIKDAAKPFVEDAIGDLRLSLEGDWELLTDEQKKSASRAAERVLVLLAQDKAGKDIREDLEFVKATVAEFVVAGEIAVATAFEEAFWEAVDKASNAFGTFLGNTGKALLKGLI